MQRASGIEHAHFALREGDGNPGAAQALMDAEVAGVFQLVEAPGQYSAANAERDRAVIEAVDAHQDRAGLAEPIQRRQPCADGGDGRFHIAVIGDAHRQRQHSIRL